MTGAGRLKGDYSMKRESEINKMSWQSELPSEDGLYEYSGELFCEGSEQAVDCSSTCRIIVRQGDGPRKAIFSEKGKACDLHRTTGGKWRGPIGPTRIPIEESRRAD